MLIVHSDGAGVTNMNAISEIRAAGRYIWAYEVGGKRHPIAAYDTEERAEAVFMDVLLMRMRCDEKMIWLPEV